MRSLLLTALSAALLGLSATPALAAGKVLNIYNWSDYIAPETVKNFEKETGIQVRYDVYDSNEVLQAKVLTGRSGYDIVVPTNAFLAKQLQANIYQPIDKNKLSNYKNLDAAVLTQANKFDPGNKYAVPYFYGINTLAINVKKVKAALGSEPMPANEWDLLFDQKYASKLKTCGVSVLDSPSEVLPIALHYLGRDPNSHNDADWQAAAELMKKARPAITRFSSSGYINELANGSICMALGYGGDLNIAKRRAEEAKAGQEIKVLAPKDGVMMWMDSMVIPKDAQNVDNAHAFINYILRPDVVAKISNATRYANANLGALKLMDRTLVGNPAIYLNDERKKTLFLQKVQSSDTTRLEGRTWMSFKKG